jgi:hypothetical protein
MSRGLQLWSFRGQNDFFDASFFLVVRDAIFLKLRRIVQTAKHFQFSAEKKLAILQRFRALSGQSKNFDQLSQEPYDLRSSLLESMCTIEVSI